MSTLLEDSLMMCKRELLVFKANARTNLIRSAIFPLVIILLFGNLGFSVSNVSVAIVNYANNLQSIQFINALELQNGVSVQAVTNENTALQMLNTGAVAFVIIILPNFPASSPGSQAVQVYYTNSEFTVSSFILPLIQQHVAQFTSAGNIQTKLYSPGAPQSSVISTPINGAGGTYKDFLFSGIIAMVIVFGALFGGGMSLITDRIGGNIKSFLVTPINKKAILLGRVMSGVVQSAIYVIVTLLVGFLNGATIAMGAVGLVLIFIIGMILGMGFTSVASIIASRMKNIQAFAIISQAIGMPLWLLSGGIFPISSLPGFLQPFAAINPLTYAADGLRYIVLQGVWPIGSAVTDLSVLIGFSVVMTLVSIRMFKSTID